VGRFFTKIPESSPSLRKPKSNTNPKTEDLNNRPTATRLIPKDQAATPNRSLQNAEKH
jgi:hypothetical protein